MKNLYLIPYLNKFLDGKINNQEEFPIAPKSEQPIIPKSVRENESAVKFFSGTNVFGEKITTDENIFSYRANFYATNECTEEELEAIILKGLNELGYSCTDLSVKKLQKMATASESQEFEITIMTM